MGEFCVSPNTVGFWGAWLQMRRVSASAPHSLGPQALLVGGEGRRQSLGSCKGLGPSPQGQQWLQRWSSFFSSDFFHLTKKSYLSHFYHQSYCPVSTNSYRSPSTSQMHNLSGPQFSTCKRRVVMLSIAVTRIKLVNVRKVLKIVPGTL